MVYKIIKDLVKSMAFVISLIAILIYAIFFHNQIVLCKENLQHIFYFFLALLPLIITIFTILISFVDSKLLKFLKESKTKDKKNSIYEEIIYYFLVNTILSLIAVILAGSVFCFDFYNNIFMQYIMIFIFTYTLISFIQIIRFIFYFAKKKADFVEIIEKRG